MFNSEWTRGVQIGNNVVYQSCTIRRVTGIVQSVCCAHIGQMYKYTKVRWENSSCNRCQ